MDSYKKKLKNIKKMASKALKNKPNWKTSKGYKYLKDIEVGNLFELSSGARGILLECDTNAKVLITHVEKYGDDNLSMSMGKMIISSKTEVKEVK